MTGIVDVGGGLRDIYGAGVLDTCLDDNVMFDCCVSVSAGSANIASYLAKQRGRNYRFYTDYVFRKEYMSVSNLVEGKHFLDLNYVYGNLSGIDGEDPIDYFNIINYGGTFCIVATDAITGRPVYFDKSEIKENDFRILNASASIPVVCGKTEIDGRYYYDGGISDPIPVKKAFELGCDKVVVILTRPVDYETSPSGDIAIASLMDAECYRCARALKVHTLRYARSLKFAKKMEEIGKCLIIAPDDCCGVETLTRDKERLDALYQKGIEDGRKIYGFINSDTSLLL